MKILLTINCAGSHTEGTVVYAEAWARFLARHSSELDRYEPLFINTGLNMQYFSMEVHPFNVFHTKRSGNLMPFDTEATFRPFEANRTNNNYDYFLRVDHEAFPSVEALNNIADMLEEHNDITLMTASNFPRSVFHHRDDMPTLDNSTAVYKDRGNYHWEPWGIPTVNGDLVVLKRSFFNECLERYETNTLIQNGTNSPHGAFDTNVLKYQDICRMLGKEPKGPNVPIFIDGCLRSDFWTIMCASKDLRVAGIVDSDGRSFSEKDHLITQYCNAIQHADSFDDLKDLVDTSFRKHDYKVSAAYFHMGSGYLADWYLDAQHTKFKSTKELFAPHFTNNTFGNYAAHYAVTKELMRRSKDKALLPKMEREFAPILKEWCVSIPHLDAFCDKVLQFYETPLRSYL